MKSWAHQSEAVERARFLPHYGLFFEVGTGKTKTAIDIARVKYTEHKRLLKTLILCPVIVKENWKREWQKFSKVGDRVTVLEGSGKKRIEQIDHWDNIGDINS